jgi:hypothetical protein
MVSGRIALRLVPRREPALALFCFLPHWLRLDLQRLDFVDDAEKGVAFSEDRRICDDATGEDRRPQDIGFRLVEILNIATIAGLPIGIAAYFWANRLLPFAMLDRAEWEIHVLFFTWAWLTGYAVLRPPKRAWVQRIYPKQSAGLSHAASSGRENAKAGRLVKSRASLPKRVTNILANSLRVRGSHLQFWLPHPAQKQGMRQRQQGGAKENADKTEGQYAAKNAQGDE